MCYLDVCSVTTSQQRANGKETQESYGTLICLFIIIIIIVIIIIIIINMPHITTLSHKHRSPLYSHYISTQKEREREKNRDKEIERKKEREKKRMGI